MKVMNADISLLTALTGYPLQEHWQHNTRPTETATTDQALDTTKKTEKESCPDHSLDIADTAALAIVTLKRQLQITTTGQAQPA